MDLRTPLRRSLNILCWVLRTEEITPATARLIAYWTDSNRERKLFFCQNEALETAIYITEIARKYGDAWIENAICKANEMLALRCAIYNGTYEKVLVLVV